MGKLAGSLGGYASTSASSTALRPYLLSEWDRPLWPFKAALSPEGEMHSGAFVRVSSEWVVSFVQEDFSFLITKLVVTHGEVPQVLSNTAQGSHLNNCFMLDIVLLISGPQKEEINKALVQVVSHSPAIVLRQKYPFHIVNNDIINDVVQCDDPAPGSHLLLREII